eukprot:2266025-Alexandrium_andersonii.AAC.1
MQALAQGGSVSVRFVSGQAVRRFTLVGSGQFRHRAVVCRFGHPVLAASAVSCRPILPLHRLN